MIRDKYKTMEEVYDSEVWYGLGDAKAVGLIDEERLCDLWSEKGEAMKWLNMVS